MRGCRAAGAALLLAACPGADRGDARAYLDAVGAADPAACAAVGDAALAAECRAYAAWELAGQGRLPEAQAACAAMEPGPWRDECWFQLSDAVQARGELARGLCAEAGAWRDHCVAHALGREAQAVLAASPPGEEAAAFARVEALAVAWVGPQKGRTRAAGILRKALAARFAPGEDFDLTRCGTAPGAHCRGAYVQLVRDAATVAPGAADGARLAAACAAPQTRAGIAALGLPAWTEGSEALALAAWGELCAAGGGTAPTAPRAARGTP